MRGGVQTQVVFRHGKRACQGPQGVTGGGEQGGGIVYRGAVVLLETHHAKLIGRVPRSEVILDANKVFQTFGHFLPRNVQVSRVPKRLAPGRRLRLRRFWQGRRDRRLPIGCGNRLDICAAQIVRLALMDFIVMVRKL